MGFAAFGERFQRLIELIDCELIEVFHDLVEKGFIEDFLLTVRCVVVECVEFSRGSCEWFVKGERKGGDFLNLGKLHDGLII